MDLITKGQKNLQLKQVLEPTMVQQSQDANIKYQNIIYYMINRTKCVYYPEQVTIDLLTAINELNGIDWTWKNNGISFINLKNDDNIFCHRLERDKWFVATKVKDGDYSGYQWISYPDHESLINTIRLFFEDLSWFDVLNWNMVRWESYFGT